MSPQPTSTSSLPEKPTLTDHLRANTHWFVDPVVTFLARYHLSPDALTFAGTLAHVAFAWLIAAGEFRWAGLAIFLVAPLDALDGALARKIGRQQGGFGAFLDSTLDRLAEVILFSGFILYFTFQDEPWLVLASYAALTGSLLVSYTRARAESLGLSAKIGILSRVERYGVLVLALILSVPAYGIVLLAVGTAITTAQRMFHVWRQTQ